MADVDVIQIVEVDATERLRPLDQLIVDAYAAIAEERVRDGLSPLIQPIVVRPSSDGYRLTAGAHRLAALAAIGREALTVGEDVVIRAEDEGGARDSEIFENIASAELSALDRAIFLREAKLRHVAKRGEMRGRKRKDQQFKEDKIMPETGIISSERFSKEAAARIGLSETQVKESVAIAEALAADVIPQLRGTMVERNQNELKQLVQLTHNNQRHAVAAIRSGEVRTIAQARVAIGLDKPERDDPQKRIYADLLDRWSRANKQTRASFLADIGAELVKKGEA